MSVVSTSSRKNGRPRGYVDEWRPRAKTRALLDDVWDVLDRYDEYLPLTIRQVFYALVGAERLDKTELAYSRLCYVLNQARRNRLIAFEDIRDDGVSVMTMRSYDGVKDFHDETARRARSYRRDRQSRQAVYVELWCEAAGMMPQLARVANAYSVPVCSCGGFASLSAVRYISDRGVDRNVPTVLLHVGDFDPSGESIFTAMTKDASAFVEADRALHTSRIDACAWHSPASRLTSTTCLRRPPRRATRARPRGTAAPASWRRCRLTSWPSWCARRSSVIWTRMSSTTSSRSRRASGHNCSDCRRATRTTRAFQQTRTATASRTNERRPDLAHRFGRGRSRPNGRDWPDATGGGRDGAERRTLADLTGDEVLAASPGASFISETETRTLVGEKWTFIAGGRSVMGETNSGSAA